MTTIDTILEDVSAAQEIVDAVRDDMRIVHQAIDIIREDIRTAYNLLVTDPAASQQYARAAHAAIIEARCSGDREAGSLGWMVADLI